MKPLIRMSVIGMLAVVGGAVFFDPYSFSENTSHFPSRAPVWQVALATADLVLLSACAVAVWKSATRRAVLLLTSATILNIAANVLFVRRDGMERFLVGFGTHEILTLYLSSLAIRILVLATLAVTQGEEHHMGR